MSYQRTDGRFVFAESAGVASATKTATGQSAAIEVGQHTALRSLTSTVTAASGTSPTLVVKVQHSVDASTWVDVPNGALASQTAAGSVSLPGVGGLGKYIRYVWTIGGTSPSFTFSIAADLV